MNITFDHSKQNLMSAIGIDPAQMFQLVLYLDSIGKGKKTEDIEAVLANETMQDNEKLACLMLILR